MSRPLRRRHSGSCAAIKRLLLAGHHTSEVASLLCISYRWVNRYALRENLPINTPLTPRLTRLILLSLSAGFTPHELSPLYRQAPSRIASLARTHFTK